MKKDLVCCCCCCCYCCFRCCCCCLLLLLTVAVAASAALLLLLLLLLSAVFVFVVAVTVAVAVATVVVVFVVRFCCYCLLQLFLLLRRCINTSLQWSHDIMKTKGILFITSAELAKKLKKWLRIAICILLISHLQLGTRRRRQDGRRPRQTRLAGLPCRASSKEGKSHIIISQISRTIFNHNFKQERQGLHLRLGLRERRERPRQLQLRRVGIGSRA